MTALRRMIRYSPLSLDSIMQAKSSYRNMFNVHPTQFLRSISAVFMVILANYALAQDPVQTQDPPALAPTKDPSPAADPSLEGTKPTPRTAPARRPTPPARPDAVQSRAIADFPPLVCEPAAVDFGFLLPNTPGEGVVLLRNTGDKPLTINLVQPSCKCTTISDLVGKQIPPGGSVELQIKLDGAPAMGVRRSSVKVMVDGYGRALDVAVKGEVSLPVRIVPPYINTIEQKNMTGRLIIESTNKKPFRILSSQGGPISIQGFDEAQDEPRSSYVVRYDLTGFSTDLPSYIFFETDVVGAGVVDVRVRQMYKPKRLNIQVNDIRSNVGLIPSGTSKEALFTFTDPEIVIESVATTSTDATVSLARTEPTKVGDTNAFVTVTPRDGFTGILLLPVTFKTATQSEDFQIIANVRPAQKSQ